MFCFKKKIYNDNIEHNKIYTGYITAYGKLAVTIKDSDGREWYGLIKQINKDYRNEINKIIGKMVSFKANKNKFSGESKNGKRYYAKNINII